MAKRSQPLIAAYLIPGALASGLLLVVAVSAFGALWFNTPDTDWQQIWDDSYLWHVVRFTFWQAFLSALFSVIGCFPGGHSGADVSGTDGLSAVMRDDAGTARAGSRIRYSVSLRT